MGRGRNPNAATTAAPTMIKSQSKSNKTEESLNEKEPPDNADENSQDSGSRKTRRSLASPKEQITKVIPNTEIGSNIRSRLRRSTQLNNISISTDEDRIQKDEIVVGAEELVISEEFSSIYSSRLEDSNEQIIGSESNIINIVEIVDETDESTLDMDSMLKERNSSLQTPTIPDSNEATCSADDDIEAFVISDDSLTGSSSIMNDNSKCNSDCRQYVIEVIDSVSQDEFAERLKINSDSSTSQSTSEYEKMNVHELSQPNKNQITKKVDQAESKSEDSGDQLVDPPLLKACTPPAEEISLEERVLPSPDFFNLPKPKIIRTYQNKRKLKADAMKKLQEVTDNITPDNENKVKAVEESEKEVKEKLGSVENTDGTECRRSQRKKVMKYDVRDLLNKKGSRTQSEVKTAKIAQLQKIKDITRRELVTSPQLFKGFSDTEDRLSPVINAKRSSSRLSNTSSTPPSLQLCTTSSSPIQAATPTPPLDQMCTPPSLISIRTSSPLDRNCSAFEPAILIGSSTPVPSSKSNLSPVLNCSTTSKSSDDVAEKLHEENVAQRSTPTKATLKKEPQKPSRILPRRKTALFNRLPANFEYSAEDTTDDQIKDTTDLERYEQNVSSSNASEIEKEIDESKSKSKGRFTRHSTKLFTDDLPSEKAVENITILTKMDLKSDQITACESNDGKTCESLSQESVSKETKIISPEKLEAPIKTVNIVTTSDTDRKIVVLNETFPRAEIIDESKNCLQREENKSGTLAKNPINIFNIAVAEKQDYLVKVKIPVISAAQIERDRFLRRQVLNSQTSPMIKSSAIEISPGEIRTYFDRDGQKSDVGKSDHSIVQELSKSSETQKETVSVSKEIDKTESSSSKLKARSKNPVKNCTSPNVKMIDSYTDNYQEKLKPVSVPPAASFQPVILQKDEPKKSSDTIKIIKKVVLTSHLENNSDVESKKCVPFDVDPEPDQRSATNSNSSTVPKPIIQTGGISEATSSAENDEKLKLPKAEKSDMPSKNETKPRTGLLKKEKKSAPNEAVHQSHDIGKAAPKNIQRKETSKHLNDLIPNNCLVTKKKPKKNKTMSKTIQVEERSENILKDQSIILKEEKAVPKETATVASDEQDISATLKNGLTPKEKSRKIPKKTASTTSADKIVSEVGAKEINDKANPKESSDTIPKTVADKVKSTKLEGNSSTKSSTKRLIEEVNMFASDSPLDSLKLLSKMKKIPKITKRVSLTKNEMNKIESNTTGTNSVVETPKSTDLLQAKIKKTPKNLKQTPSVSESSSEMNSSLNSDPKTTLDGEILTQKNSTHKIVTPKSFKRHLINSEPTKSMFGNFVSSNAEKILDCNKLLHQNKPKKTKNIAKSKIESTSSLENATKSLGSTETLNQIADSGKFINAEKIDSGINKNVLNESSTVRKHLDRPEKEVISSELSALKKTKPATIESRSFRRNSVYKMQSPLDVNKDSISEINAKHETKLFSTEKYMKHRDNLKSTELIPSSNSSHNNIVSIPDWKPLEPCVRPEIPGPMIPPVLNGLSSSMMNDLLQWACNNTQALSKIKHTVDQNQRMSSPNTTCVQSGILNNREQIIVRNELKIEPVLETTTRNDSIINEPIQYFKPRSPPLNDIKEADSTVSEPLSTTKGKNVKESLQMLVEMSREIDHSAIPDSVHSKSSQSSSESLSLDFKKTESDSINLSTKLDFDETSDTVKSSDSDSIRKSTDTEQIDSNSQDDSTNIRRSHRIKTQVKCNTVGRGLVRDKDVCKPVNDRNQKHLSTSNLAAHNAKFLKDMEERLSQFQVIKENEYKCERIVSKEAKKMTCDCFLTRDEEDRGELGCGEDCLNRLLMIECTPKCTVGERCTNRRFQKNAYAPCKVFRTEKKGFGIMADDEIVSGEFIMEYVGEVLNGQQFEKRANVYSQDKNKHYYFMALRSDSIIDATGKGNISRFINHSCDPNAETQKWTVNGELRIGFFSKRRISRGEEITFDYQFQRYGKEAQKCYCESENCRGWIGEEPDSDEEEDEELASESDDGVETETETKSLDEKKSNEMDVSIGEKVDEKNRVPSRFESGDVVMAETTEDLSNAVQDITPPIQNLAEASELQPEKQSDKSLKAAQKFEKIALKLKAKRERERIKQQNRMVMEDPDLDKDIISLNHSGLKNQAHTLKLSRCMVRGKSLQTRIRLLEILQKGEMACRRLFLDYHGLRLLHGWMSETETIDIEQDLEFRLIIAETLELLPIPNKTMLKDSKVFQTIQSWSNEIEDDISPSYSPTDSVDDSPPAKRQKPDDQAHHPIRLEIKRIANKLVAAWEVLPEVFRIPKRERIEQMKEHEREANRQYKALNITDDYHENFQKQRRNKERFGIKKSYKWSRDKPDRDKKGKDSAHRDLDKSSSAEANLSKLQRRQLFAAKVAKDEAEKRLAEERREFEIKCRFYGIDPKCLNTRDLPFCVHPATGQWYSQDKRKISTPPSHSHIKVPSKPQSTDPKDYNMPEMDLPPLWKFALDTCGRIYYYHIKIRIPQWEPPIKILPLTNDAGTVATETTSTAETTTTPTVIEPKPGTSKQTATPSGTSPSGGDSSGTDSDSDISCSEIIGLKKGIPGRPVKESVEQLRESKRRKRYNRLVQERTISPRREEDRLYNQIEMRRYRENKEKLRRRKEEIKRRKAQIVRRQQESPIPSTSSASTIGPISQIESLGKPQQYQKLPLPPVLSPLPPDSLSLPIQDYLISSDEDDLSKSDYDNSLIEKIVHGDKIVDEFDAISKEKLLKRALPIKDRTDYKKRIKLDDKKRVESNKGNNSDKPTKPRKSTGETGNTKYQARKAREKFRSDIAGIIVHHLTPYRRDSCILGRITTNEDFKHLARKLTHFVMIKELKHCDSTGQILVVTESVKNKSREFIKKYMAKYGEVYVRPENDPEFKDIPH